MDRNEKARTIFRAERLERSSKQKGKRIGDLGQSGLQVLRALLFRFQTPCPSIKAIATHTGLAVDTVCNAIARLKAAGLIEVQRRWRRTRLGPRVITNLYRVIPITVQPSKPIERKKLPPLQGELKEALDRLAQHIAATDPSSPSLSRTLTGCGA